MRHDSTVPQSNSPEEAHARFLNQLRQWAQSCMQRYADEPPTDGHDQLTYTTGWEPLFQAGDFDAGWAFLTGARDQVATHFENSGAWHHGYWRAQEVHHGTEHFELFLGCMARLDPDDGETRRQLLDACEHILNRVSMIPPWYDTATNLFRSLYLGTEIVRLEESARLNTADHFRLVNLCLIANALSNETSFLQFARTYAGGWADAMLRSRELPIGLGDDGPLYALPADSDYTFVGVAENLKNSGDLERAENILASGGIDALLELWHLTGEDRFRNAAERLLDVLVSQLSDPDAGAAAAILGRYRRMTHSQRYDQNVLDAVSNLDPHAVVELSIEPRSGMGRWERGIGKRGDMPFWFEDGAPRRHNPVLLSLASEILDDSELRTRALDLAATHFRLAVDALPDGRHHGCAANTVSAVARGHGRENNAGMATALLMPRLGATV